MRSRPCLVPLEDRTAPATFTVTTLSDATAADGQTTLREAVALANTTPGPDAIAFDPSLAGGTITLGAAGGLSLSEDATITGFPATPVAVAGGFAKGTVPADVFLVQAGVAAAISGLAVSNTTPLGHGVTNLGTLTLDHVTISGVTGGSGLRNSGTATVTNSDVAGNTTAATFEGGGATNLAGTLTIRDSRIEGNQSRNVGAGSGGGLFQVAGTVNLSNVTLANNFAEIAGGGVAVVAGTFTATGGRVTGNAAPLAGGLGFLGLDPPDGTSPVTNAKLTGVTVDVNRAGTGGGLGVATGTFGFDPTVALTDCTVANNFVDADTTQVMILGVTADGSETIAVPRGTGGGLAVAGGTVTVTGGSFATNKATGGGGIAVLLGTVTTANTTVSGNTAVSGAGASVVGSSAGAAAATFTATTFENNAAAAGQTGVLSYAVPGVTTPTVTRGAGGGVYADTASVTLATVTAAGNSGTTGGGLAAGGGTAEVQNSTLANNTASNTGGGVWVTGGTVTVRSSIAAGNVAPTAQDASGSIMSAGGNVVGVTDGVTGFGSIDHTGTAAAPLAAKLGTLADNGGPTRTLLPAANSPAVDAGDGTAATATDQRGRPRVSGTGIDAGAVERQPDDPTGVVQSTRVPLFAVGPDRGTAAPVRVFNTDGTERFSAAPFGDAFSNGVRVATADFTGDGVDDLVVGTGPGVVTRVLVLDGTTRATLFDVSPFEASFTGGVYVSAGDVTGDGVPDLAISPDEGGGPRVDVYRGAAGFPKLISFFGIDDPNFRGGARSSIADLNGDGVGDLVVVAGFGGGPRVAGFDGKSLASTPAKLFGDFFAFEPTLRNGVFVAAGDVNGDGVADLIAGGGPGGGPRVLAFDGKSLLQNQQVPIANFFGGDVDSRGGIRVAVKDLDGDARADLVVGSGAGAGGRVAAYLGKNIGPAGTPLTDLDFDAVAGSTAGVFVG